MLAWSVWDAGASAGAGPSPPAPSPRAEPPPAGGFGGRFFALSPNTSARKRLRLNVASCKANSSQKYHCSTWSNTRRSWAVKASPCEPFAQRLAVLAAQVDLVGLLHRGLSLLLNHRSNKFGCAVDVWCSG